MDLLRRLDQGWRVLRGRTPLQAHNEQPTTLSGPSQQGMNYQQPPVQQATAAVHGDDAANLSAAGRAPPTTPYSADQDGLKGSDVDKALREEPKKAIISALAGYDISDSIGSSDVSRVTPLGIQVWDHGDLENQDKKHDKDGSITGAAGEGHVVITRRSLPVRLAAATAAAAGVAWRATQKQAQELQARLSRLGKQVAPAGPPEQLPTHDHAVEAVEVEKQPLKQKLASICARQPACAAVWSLAGLALIGLIIGLAIGLTTRGGGPMQPWWASGGTESSDLSWVPTGDIQLDSLMRLKHAVDTRGILTGWDPSTGTNGGFCSWDYVACDDTKQVVQVVNLTTNTYKIVLTGSLPSGEMLSGLSGLKALDIREHYITGTLPEDWAMLSLETIKLDQNLLTGPLPAAWFSSGPLSSSLKVLTLGDNKLTGQLPDSNGAMQNLELLDLSFNGFSGSLPSSWSSMTHLQQLWLDVNQLSGQLPSSWGEMATLEKLVLSENQLTGGLPAAWSGMRGMKELWVEFNKLSGQLPDALKSWTQLHKLVLNNNNFAEWIPPSWTAMTQLQAVYTYNNTELTGCVPRIWKAQLESDFDVEYYVLEGTGLKGFCATS